MSVIHDIFREIKAYKQEQGIVDHPTTIKKIKQDFAVLPDADRQPFLDWANTHIYAHLKDILEETT